VRTGKSGAAVDYVSNWLVDLAGSQFEKRELIEENRHTQKPPDATFTGRADILEFIARSVVSTDLAGQGLPWLFSISSPGGAGKSYLLNVIQENYTARLLTARLDHLDYTDAKGDLISLVTILASKFRNAGCPTPAFDKVYQQQFPGQETAEEAPRFSREDIAREVGRVLTGAGAKKLALQLSNTFNKFWFVKHVPGFIGVGASIIEIGIGLFGQVTQEQQEEIDTLLGSRPVQELTQALVTDLAKFVDQQRDKYYLWRRPMLVFDTYEQAGPVVDQWLRTVLLVNPALRVLEPVVLIAGRFELLTYDSRWSDYQSGLRNFHLYPFDLAETTEYLTKLGITDPGRIANLYEVTGGLPLFLHLAANLTSEASIVKVLAERLLEEVEPEWRNSFLEMAQPDGFNLETVRRYTNPKSQAEAFYEELTRASFVEIRGNLWHFLPAVRQIFLRYRELKGRP
jgi:hypothetical protein